MKTYTITFTITGSVTVDAHNEDEAFKIAHSLTNEEILEEVEIALVGDSIAFGEIIDEEEKSTHRWYFTFGTDPNMPYQSGWVEILADTLADAIEKFKTRFGDKAETHPGCLNCAFWYSEEQFNRSGMKNGNFGFKCHEVIE